MVLVFLGQRPIQYGIWRAVYHHLCVSWAKSKTWHCPSFYMPCGWPWLLRSLTTPFTYHKCCNIGFMTIGFILTSSTPYADVVFTCWDRLIPNSPRVFNLSATLTRYSLSVEMVNQGVAATHATASWSPKDSSNPPTTGQPIIPSQPWHPIHPKLDFALNTKVHI